MSSYLIQGETLTAIAEAIRKKTGETDELTPEAMVDAIATIIGAPEGIAKIDGGILVPTSDVTEYIHMEHNLGEIPDFYFYSNAADISSQSSYPCKISEVFFRKKHYSSSTQYGGFYQSVYRTSSGTRESGIGSINESSISNYVTETTVRLTCSTSYPFKSGNKYIWCCIKFSDYAE